MKRQQIRKMLLIISLLLFPVTLYYFSPALIINAGLQGIINGSFLVFCLLFLLSIPFGRSFCAYLCPAGGLQECASAVKEKNPKQGRRLWIKYGIWTVWMAAVISCYFHSGGIVAVDFLFETEHGISVSSMQSYLIYYGILCLILIPAFVCGKRAFCHYFCWMAPFMVLGTKLREVLHLPGLHIRAGKPEQCIACGKCAKVCPMGIDVVSEIKGGEGKDREIKGGEGKGRAIKGREGKSGAIRSAECIQCGACVENCPRGVLSKSFRY